MTVIGCRRQAAGGGAGRPDGLALRPGEVGEEGDLPRGRLLQPAPRERPRPDGPDERGARDRGRRRHQQHVGRRRASPGRPSGPAGDRGSRRPSRGSRSRRARRSRARRAAGRSRPCATATTARAGRSPGRRCARPSPTAVRPRRPRGRARGRRTSRSFSGLGLHGEGQVAVGGHGPVAGEVLDHRQHAGLREPGARRDDVLGHRRRPRRRGPGPDRGVARAGGDVGVGSEVDGEPEPAQLGAAGGVRPSASARGRPPPRCS